MTDRERLLDEPRPGAFAIACPMLSSVSGCQSRSSPTAMMIRPHAETADSLSPTVLVLLESLSPGQRAVLLHDVFDYGYPDITAIVGKSEDNVRQLATRASRHVKQRRPRFATTREQREDWHGGSSRP